MKPIELALVVPRQPCNACAMLVELARGVAARLAREIPGVTLTEIILEKPADAARVPGLEVPDFPALLAGGIQMTAGSIPDRKRLARQLAAMMEEE